MIHEVPFPSITEIQGVADATWLLWMHLYIFKKKEKK